MGAHVQQRALVRTSAKQAVVQVKKQANRNYEKLKATAAKEAALAAKSNQYRQQLDTLKARIHDEHAAKEKAEAEAKKEERKQKTAMAATQHAHAMAVQAKRHTKKKAHEAQAKADQATQELATITAKAKHAIATNAADYVSRLSKVRVLRKPRSAPSFLLPRR